MAINPNRLKEKLVQTKTQKTNNALFQTIEGIIDNLNNILGSFLPVTIFEAFIAQTRFIEVVEIDTSGAPVTIDLSQYVFNNFMIFKDISGNASGSNITLTGTVDGVVDPVINTDFGYMQIYKSLSLNSLHEW